MNSSFRPTASPSPENSPMIDASRPITSASTITEASTCRRDAPIVRSVANSRVRCATVIDSVLKITKAPTNRAMPANVSRKYRMIVVNVATSSESSLACSVPDRTVTDVPSSSRMRVTSSSGATPSSAAACTASSSPSLSRSAWAVGMSKMANVAPPSELSSPYRAIPTISNSWAGPRAATPIRSPSGEVLVVGDPLVDRELPRARRPAALDEVERIEAVVLGRGLDAEREGGGASRVDRLAVRLEQLGLEVGHRAGRHLDAVDVPDLLEDVLRDRSGLRLLALEADAGVLAADDRVGAGVRLDEDGVERLVDRVREHVGAAHHRDAEDDRDRRQHRPELAPGEAAERDPDHRNAISSTRREHLMFVGAAQLLDDAGRPRGRGSDRRSPQRARRA